MEVEEWEVESVQCDWVAGRISKSVSNFTDDVLISDVGIESSFQGTFLSVPPSNFQTL